MPRRMRTVLVARRGAEEACTGYWDGDAWYSSDGHPLHAVTWWMPLPPLPDVDAGHTHH